MRQRRPSNSTTRWMPGIDLQPASWNGGGTKSWEKKRQASNGFPVSMPNANPYRGRRWKTPPPRAPRKHPTRAREETPESRGMPCPFLNTERGFGGKPPKNRGFVGILRGQKCLKRDQKCLRRRLSRRSPVGEWSRGARSMPRVFGTGRAAVSRPRSSATATMQLYFRRSGSSRDTVLQNQVERAAWERAL